MRGWFAVYYRELLIIKRRLWKLLASMAVSPFLYLVAFGYAMGKGVEIDGRPYLEYLLPGLVAMSTMTQSFAISSEINITRFYWQIFEEFQAAPIRNLAYVTGEVCAGITRALLSVLVILVLGAGFGVLPSLNPAFWGMVLLNSLTFSALAVCLAMLVKSHADQALLNSFIITPMAFLGGTFFPVERLPAWAQGVLSFLPLTHASRAIRASAHGMPAEGTAFVFLGVSGACFFGLALLAVNAARD